MKLIFVNRFFYPDLSATSQLLSDLAFDLAALGVEVHIITSRGLYVDPSTRLPKSQKVQDVQIHRVWTTGFGRSRLRGRLVDYLSFTWTAALKLWRLAAAGDTVVVMSDPPLFSVSALLILRLRGARLINWLQDFFPEIAFRAGLISPSGFLSKTLLRLRNWTLRGARLNIAISDGIQRCIYAQGVDAHLVEVIPNWTDGRFVYPVPSHQNQLRQSWGLAEKFVVGHSGNLGRVHETKTIKLAIQGLAADDHFVFVFVGGGKGYEDLREWATERNFANVQFHPYQPKDRLHLSLSLPDVHLISLAPEMEGLVFPSKLYGILAAGRPAIFVGAHESEVAELLKGAGCGTGVEAGHGDELAEAILHLKNNRLRQVHRHRPLAPDPAVLNAANWQAAVSQPLGETLFFLLEGVEITLVLTRPRSGFLGPIFSVGGVGRLDLELDRREPTRGQS